MNLGFVIDIILIVWLLLLSALAVWLFLFYRKLAKGVDKGNLVKILENVILKEKSNTDNINEVIKRIIKIQERITTHIQKVGVVRFNPFREMGGDHSFSLALLDGKENGFIITGLHTRERTRVYVKVIRKGKSEVELSKEENKALKEALK